ncbi:MAG: threonine synthase [Candidatus Aminicenantes bacterium]|nr:threonine synthase [Candidatus Aminicenantes bacterium]
MRYIGTHANHPFASASEAVLLGMVPRGGLFVPEFIPQLEADTLAQPDYLETARRIMAAYFTDFAPDVLDSCLRRTYNRENFHTPDIVNLRPLGRRRFLLELFHGPTAAFKDVALQLMPHLTTTAKSLTGDKTHTLILVATSGDTGKAALEGYKNVDGISIVVFYPQGGVSEVQRLQMATTDGRNTKVFAVRGNFDDCQTGAKALFLDSNLRDYLTGMQIKLSTGNSINWGRLAPQIVYYVRAYALLAARGEIKSGDEVDICVPTGNFGNILAAWYARAMGLPVRKLFCASNKNNILTDFFQTGVYDTHREFHRTSSPSMDILISSNLERFLFEIAGRDAEKIKPWFLDRFRTGRFQIDAETKKAIDALVVPGWADEPRVFAEIKNVHEETGMIIDTHTAVASAVSRDIGPKDGPATIIASTASPFKFAGDVLAAITGEAEPDEFKAIDRLSELAGEPAHRAVRGLQERPVLHEGVLPISQMREAVIGFAEGVKTRT